MPVGSRVVHNPATFDCARVCELSDMTISPSYLAVVPAYNESSTIVGVIEALRDRAPRLRCAGRGRRFDGRHRRDGDAGRGARAAAAVQSRHRRRRPGGLRVRTRSSLRLRGPGRRQTGSTSPRELDKLVAAIEESPRPTWCADRGSSPTTTTTPLPSAAAPASTSSRRSCRGSSTSASAIRHPAFASTTGGRSSCSRGIIRTTIPRSKRC